MSTPESELPPVPYQFVASPENYHLAVKLYLDSVIARAQQRAGGGIPPSSAVISVLSADAKALNQE